MNCPCACGGRGDSACKEAGDVRIFPVESIPNSPFSVCRLFSYESSGAKKGEMSEEEPEPEPENVETRDGGEEDDDEGEGDVELYVPVAEVGSDI